MSVTRVLFGAFARCDGFEESGRACLTLGLGGDGTDCLRVFAWWTFGVDETGIGHGAAARCEGCEGSGCANIALGMRGRSPSYLRVLARWTLGVGEAPLKRTNCRQRNAYGNGLWFVATLCVFKHGGTLTGRSLITCELRAVSTRHAMEVI